MGILCARSAGKLPSAAKECQLNSQYRTSACFWQSQNSAAALRHCALLRPALLPHRISYTAQSAARPRLAQHSPTDYQPIKIEYLI